ncbi:hypothetical protein BDZ97DRAFT_1752483 [Flammula alnicola]|nr:hypothetical protein BDZ97DRAFT_1752483 [Flammula alnicola]
MPPAPESKGPPVSDSKEEGDIHSGSTLLAPPTSGATVPSPQPIPSRQPTGGPESSASRAPHAEEDEEEAVIPSMVADHMRNCMKAIALPLGINSSEESKPEEEVPKSKKRKG